ncbi:MAG: hypothetical protein LBE14_05255 [Treponema sp.]|jgi:hypothetical protein|nr:hypothetical protein [Treponema sp.]
MKGHGRIWRHVFLIPAAAAFIAVLGCAVMLLWNALLPRIAGLPPVNFWEAAGLLILARILFGGPGGIGRHDGHKNLFKEKWLRMSEEERKEFAARFHGFHRRQGFCGEGDNSSGSSPPPGSTGEEKE